MSPGPDVAARLGVVAETSYARSGDVSIAYQVSGAGAFDVVLIPPAASHVEICWEVPVFRAMFERLGSFARVIHFDKRGTGMSDRVVGVPTLETRMDDVRAVMDAAGSRRAALLGWSEGVAMSVLFAATYPDRTSALVLYGGKARQLRAPDYAWGLSEGEMLRAIAEGRARQEKPGWAEEAARSGSPTATELEIAALEKLFRYSSSPGADEAFARMNMLIDVRNVAPAVRVPTLVLHNTMDGWVAVERGRDLARRIPGATFAEFPTEGHITPVADIGAVLDKIEPFLRDAWAAAESGQDHDRVLSTVLFTDIVDATATAAELGDSRWREVLERHHAVIRRELARARGKEIDTAGDGFFAAFDGPARAIRCACAITEAVKGLGLDVRAGLHTGECELVDGKIAGIAVHTGARVASQAQPGEVLVSGTVKDLVAGSGIQFEERGVHDLKGIPGEWHLFAVARQSDSLSTPASIV